MTPDQRINARSSTDDEFMVIRHVLGNYLLNQGVGVHMWRQFCSITNYEAYKHGWACHNVVRFIAEILDHTNDPTPSHPQE